MAVGCIVPVVSRISVSVGIVSVVPVAMGKEGWVVSDVEGRRTFDVDHFPDGDLKISSGYVRPPEVNEPPLGEGEGGEGDAPFLEVRDCPKSVFQSLVKDTCGAYSDKGAGAERGKRVRMQSGHSGRDMER